LSGRQRRFCSELIGDRNAINPDCPCNILDLLIAHILESEIELVAHLVAHDPADANAAGIRQGFEAGGDIDTVAVDVVLVDNDVAEIDPDAEPDAAVLGHAGFAIYHCPLQLGGTADRVHDAREFRQHAIAGILDDAPGMLADLRVDEFAAMRLEPLVGALLVHAHQARVACHISGENRRQPALDPLLLPGTHRSSLPRVTILPQPRLR
jgi:hypothetical protein